MKTNQIKKIRIPKQSGGSIRKDGKSIRVSLDVDSKLTELSDDTGFTKSRLADFLLRKSLEMVEVVEVESEI